MHLTLVLWASVVQLPEVSPSPAAHLVADLLAGVPAGQLCLAHPAAAELVPATALLGGDSPAVAGCVHDAGAGRAGPCRSKSKCWSASGQRSCVLEARKLVWAGNQEAARGEQAKPKCSPAHAHSCTHAGAQTMLIQIGLPPCSPAVKSNTYDMCAPGAHPGGRAACRGGRSLDSRARTAPRSCRGHTQQGE